MEIVSSTPLRVASLLWRRATNAWVQTVVCKATFDLLPGEAKLAPHQDPLHDDDRPRDGDPAKSLYAAGDLVPLKERADVLLVGQAFAPGGRPVRSLVARLLIGTVEKAVEVFGDRTWDASGNLHERAPFASRSLAYEHAAGGPDTWNPVGVPLDPSSTNAPLPHLQPLGQKLARRGDFLAPIGLGPIAPAWPLRAQLLGHLAPTFSPARLRHEPLPRDLDAAFFNAAPADQQVDEIHPDEQIVLENLHPEHPRLVTRLPGLAPQVWLELQGAPAQKVKMRADTLWIDTDRALATVTWRGQIPLRAPDEAGRIAVTLDAPGTHRPADRTPAATEDMRGTLPLGAELPLPTPVLPFAPTTRREETAPAPMPPLPPVVPPPPLVGPTVKDPALAGVLAASNAAAGVSAKTPALAVEAKAAPDAKPARVKPREVIELLWYDPAALPRIRRNLAWKKIIADLKPRPSDDDFDGGLPPDQMKAAKDKRDVLGVLARGEVMDMDGIRRAMEMAVLEDGSFVPPYVLTAGTLEMLFDEMETLKATLIAVAPFVPLDKKLKETVDYVNEVMKTPGLERARTVVTGLCERVRAAFVPQGRGVPAGYLEETVEAMLVEGRHYRKREVVGRAHVRAMLVPVAGSEAVVAYLAENLGKELPIVRQFETKAIVEACTAVEASRASDITLRPLALGWTRHR